MRLKVNVKNPRENRCFQTVIAFSFGSVDNLNKCTVLWKMAARLITVSTSVNNEMWVKLRLRRVRVVLLNGCRLTQNRRVQLVSLQRVPTQTPTPRHCMRNDYTSAPPKSVTVSDAGDRLLVKVDADEVHCRAPGLGKRGHGQNSSSLPQDQRFCKPSRRPSPPSRRPSPPSHSFNSRPAAMRRKQV